MIIKVGDRFVKDTRFGRISYTVMDIEYSWGMYGILKETICYHGAGTSNTTWRKTRQNFEDVINHFNARRIPKGEIGNIQTYLPRHKLTL